MRKSCRSGIVSLYDVKGVSLVVLEYTYEGVLTEDGVSSESLVACICNRADEFVYGFIDLFGGKIGSVGLVIVHSPHAVLEITEVLYRCKLLYHCTYSRYPSSVIVNNYCLPHHT